MLERDVLYAYILGRAELEMLGPSVTKKLHILQGCKLSELYIYYVV
jgi:hypothetical protein